MNEAAETTANGHERKAHRGLDQRMLRQAASHLNTASLKDGTWFKKLVADHAKKHQETVTTASWDAIYPGLDEDARAERHVKQVAIKASTAGVLASIGASTGELLSLFTEGLAAPVGVPAAALAMGLEAAYTALLQIDLACDLASIYGVSFKVDDTGELATLFAVALDLKVEKSTKGKGAEAAEPHDGGGLFERLIDLEEGEIAGRIGRKLLEEAVMKHVIPVVGLAIAGRWNYVATKLFGLKASRYVRYRRAVRRGFSTLQCNGLADPMSLIQGAWLLSTCDGDATHEEVMAIALLADMIDPEKKMNLQEARVDDEDDWLERLARVPREQQRAVLDVLYLVTGTDREITPPERRILTRVGKAFGCRIDFARIESICDHLSEGKDLPTNFAEHNGAVLR